VKLWEMLAARRRRKARLRYERERQRQEALRGRDAQEAVEEVAGGFERGVSPHNT
jgi:hypothetical protein